MSWLSWDQIPSIVVLEKVDFHSYLARIFLTYHVHWADLFLILRGSITLLKQISHVFTHHTVVHPEKSKRSGRLRKSARKVFDASSNNEIIIPFWIRLPVSKLCVPHAHCSLAACTVVPLTTSNLVVLIRRFFWCIMGMPSASAAMAGASTVPVGCEAADFSDGLEQPLPPLDLESWWYRSRRHHWAMGVAVARLGREAQMTTLKSAKRTQRICGKSNRPESNLQ